MTTYETLQVVNPATGEPITTLPAASADDVVKAAERARQVFDAGVWSRLRVRERAAVLLRMADLMERDAEILARLDSEDAGKPITECRTGDVPGAIESIRWFAEAADKVFGRVAPSGPDGLGLMSREPVGVVAAVLPWNYPLAMTAWKVGPALAMKQLPVGQARRGDSALGPAPGQARCRGRSAGRGTHRAARVRFRSRGGSRP